MADPSVNPSDAATYFAAASGIIGTVLGAIVGAFVAWRTTSSTNKVQKQIADSNAQLQQKLAQASFDFQKKLAEDTARQQQRSAIDGMVLKLIELGMLYPYLEKEENCRAWPNPKLNDSAKERYEAYCCFVFNLLEHVWVYCAGNRQKIQEVVHAEELIRCHFKWWESELDNYDGYAKGFRDYVRDEIDDLKRKGVCK